MEAHRRVHVVDAAVGTCSERPVHRSERHRAVEREAVPTLQARTRLDTHPDAQPHVLGLQPHRTRRAGAGNAPAARSTGLEPRPRRIGTPEVPRRRGRRAIGQTRDRQQRRLSVRPPYDAIQAASGQADRQRTAGIGHRPLRRGEIGKRHAGFEHPRAVDDRAGQLQHRLAVVRPERPRPQRRIGLGFRPPPPARQEAIAPGRKAFRDQRRCGEHSRREHPFPGGHALPRVDHALGDVHHEAATPVVLAQDPPASVVRRRTALARQLEPVVQRVRQGLRAAHAEFAHDSDARAAAGVAQVEPRISRPTILREGSGQARGAGHSGRRLTQSRPVAQGHRRCEHQQGGGRGTCHRERPPQPGIQRRDERGAAGECGGDRQHADTGQADAFAESPLQQALHHARADGTRVQGQRGPHGHPRPGHDDGDRDERDHRAAKRRRHRAPRHDRPKPRASPRARRADRAIRAACR